MEPSVSEKQFFPIDNCAVYEFTKSFVKSAVSKFDQLKEKSDKSKYYGIGASTASGAVALASTAAGPFKHLIGSSIKEVAEYYDKILQQKKQLSVISTIDAKSSQNFAQEFPLLFIRLGLRVYDMYKVYFEYINLKIKTIKTVNENKLLAIQKLGEYAGARCFSHMLEHSSKSEDELLNALTKKSMKRELSSKWDSKVLVELYFWAQKGSQEPKQKVFTPYELFAENVFNSTKYARNFKSDVELTNLNQPSKTRKKIKKVKHYKLLKTRSDQQGINTALEFSFDFQEDDLNCLVKFIYDKMCHDETFSWNEAVFKIVEDTYRVASIANRDISMVCDNIRKNTDNCQEIKETTKIIQDELAQLRLQYENQDPPPKNIRFQVEKPIQTFTGREAFLKQLDDMVKQKDVGITVLTQEPLSVVAATGGIGKTETVRMYIQHHADEYDHIIWIDAEDNSSAKHQFKQLAIELKISRDFDGTPKKFELILKQIFEKLLQHAQLLLVVFDNAEAYDDEQENHLSGIRGFLPKSLSPFFIEPTIIVTSRNQNWNLQNVIHLDLWTEEECVSYVICQLKLEKTCENNKLALSLGNLFGRLPIALQSVVAVIHQQTKRTMNKNYGIQNLLEEYEKGSRKVLVRKPWDANMRPTQTSLPMLILWNISLEKIVKFTDGELAIKILCFMAYLSTTRIPQDFLVALFKNSFSQDSLENALKILMDYSLITRASYADSDSQSQSLTIHRMIQDATVENLRINEGQTLLHHIFHEKTFLNETEVLLKLSAESVNYIKTVNNRVLRSTADIVENLLCLTNHVSAKLHLKEFRNLTESTGDVLRNTNDFKKSIELYERVLQAIPSYQVDSEILENLEFKWKLALTYRDGGFAQKSLELHFQNLEDQKKLSLTRPCVYPLQTKGEIARLLLDLGKYDKAMEKFSEVLQEYQDLGYTRIPAFLHTQSSFGVALLTQGRAEDALKIFQEVLKEREKNPDLYSEELITTKTSIASALNKQGKIREASEMMKRSIEDAVQVLGPFHLETLNSKRNYAQLLQDQGKSDLAISLYLELVEIQETHYGSEHPSTLATKNNLANLYLKTHELDKALPLLDVKLCERVLGPEHPQTRTTANSLVCVLCEQGKYKDALTLSDKVCKLYEQAFGPNHPQTMRMTNNIGCLNAKLGDFDKAFKATQTVLFHQEEVLGKNHPTTVETLKWLTICKKILGEQNDIIAIFSALTSINAETVRGLLDASYWNVQIALEFYYKPNPDEDIARLEHPDQA